MGIWGIAIKDNDTFADVYGEFFELYNQGGQPNIITKDIINRNKEILKIDEEKHNLWFAIAQAQWETMSLDPKILTNVEKIISSGEDLKIWLNLGASEQELNKRKIILEKFIEKIKSVRPRAIPRKRTKSKTPIFETGDCLVFKLANNNYGGAVVLATDNDNRTACNLVATTRLQQTTKPTIKDFDNAEVLICNFEEWKDKQNVLWCFPDLFKKNYSDIYENIGKIIIDVEYDPTNYEGKDYLFKPGWTSLWEMKNTAEKQFESELSKPKPTINLFIKQLTKKDKK